MQSFGRFNRIIKSLGVLFIQAILAVPIPMIVGFFPEGLAEKYYSNTYLQPIAPAMSLCAAILGYVIYKFWPKREAKYIWMIFVGFFLWAIASALIWPEPYTLEPNRWIAVFHQYFGAGPQCSSSECLYEFFCTMPTACAIAYSLGAYLQSKTGRSPKAKVEIHS